MGYRSDGKIWIDKSVVVPDDVKLYLSQMEYNERTGIYSFEYWKWYSDFENINAIETFLDNIGQKLYDIVVIGEDGAIVVEPHNKKFMVETIVTILAT